MAAYLIEGLSGTGKSTLCKELQRRGYIAYEADEAFGYFGDPATGAPSTIESPDNWFWDLRKVEAALANRATETIFVCGGAMNQLQCERLFAMRFTLVVDNATLVQRLSARGNTTLGKQQLAQSLQWNTGVAARARKLGRIPIDAMRPVQEVVDELLSQILPPASRGEPSPDRAAPSR